MTHAIRPDVHARFLALVARADAKVRSERQALRKRPATLLVREARQRAHTAVGPDNAA
ncbi:MAG TPA: hypothetical protein VFL90_22310 [Methylomirabilota bacterium]|nr:hypothetical protein [Methylomirabilota bacterium]